MSSLYQRKDSSYWWWSARYKGKNLLQSTKQTSKRYAEKIRQKWDYLLMTDDLSFYRKNLNKTSSKFSTYILVHMKDLEKKGFSKRDLSNANGILTRLKDFCLSQKVTYLDGITVRVLQDYINSQTKLAPKTKKNQRQIISKMLDRAKIEGLIDNNPAPMVELPKMKQVRPRRPFEPIDLRIIFKNAEKWKLFYAFLNYTGLRAGDVAMLKYENIDLIKRTISCYVQKSRKDVILPFSDSLTRAISNGKDETPIFPELFTKSKRKLNGNLAKPRKYLQRILKENNRPHADLHCFRHTFNDALKNLGLGENDRSVLFAQSSAKVNKIYSHPNLDVARTVINKIPDYFNPGIGSHLETENVVIT